MFVIWSFYLLSAAFWENTVTLHLVPLQPLHCGSAGLREPGVHLNPEERMVTLFMPKLDCNKSGDNRQAGQEVTVPDF